MASGAWVGYQRRMTEDELAAFIAQVSAECDAAFARLKRQ